VVTPPIYLPPEIWPRPPSGGGGEPGTPEHPIAGPPGRPSHPISGGAGAIVIYHPVHGWLVWNPSTGRQPINPPAPGGPEVQPPQPGEPTHPIAPGGGEGGEAPQPSPTSRL